jgi:dimethylamine/trimethylamine dehydrogenase
MTRDSRYDILFEPVAIGPVTAKNRFYQVPHCNGMGYLRPKSLAAMRGMKAEGGWSVVCTEEAEIHPSSEVSPHAEGRIWDDNDIPAHRLMTDAVHEHGGLAGIELCHNGFHTPNRLTRVPPMAPSPISVSRYEPVQARGMDKSDIREFRTWHRDAALRAKRAGYDVVYVYAAHNLALPMHFINRRYNQRTDEYGGSLENRVRLLRELIEDTKDAVGDSCGVAVRFAVDELLGDRGITSDGEGREVIEMLAEMPDLWDVNVSDWANDSVTARFEPQEGYQEKYTAFVKSLTTKPVVGVGRFTSADAMVSQIKRGVLDMIGSARPSIADPFLPKKIEEGRIEDIRECIGCNICVSSDHHIVPLRCTQNPTMGEEWRRGWHPEKIEDKASDDAALVVGAGPAGLECALALANRGYDVILAEAGSELGGRVSRESQLPGMASYARVRDYREYQLSQKANVEIYRDSELSAEQVREFGFPHVFLATGSSWRRDGVGRWNRAPLAGLDTINVVTPDDIMAGATVGGEVVIFDDEHYYMASVLAEKLTGDGCRVTYVTPAADVANWTHNTLEQGRIQKRLLELNVRIAANAALTAIKDGGAELTCTFTSKSEVVAADAVVMVTERQSNDALYRALQSDPDALSAAGIETLCAIGDCLAPGTVAAAVYFGHLAARELGNPNPDAAIFRWERPAL